MRRTHTIKDKYFDLNLLHLAEKLETDEHIVVKRETLRGWAHDIHTLSEDEAALLFAGNVLPDASQPIAQAYAGHQFGNFTMLGDGRAILLGEHLTPVGDRFNGLSAPLPKRPQKGHDVNVI